MAKALLTIDMLRGRNNVDPPLLVPNDQCVEAMDVELSTAGFCKKRNGSSPVSLTFSGGGGGPFTGPLYSLFRHVPAANEAASELWAIDASATPKWGRLVATTWVQIFPADEATAGSQMYATSASFNGKLFLAYNSAVDRLHVWDGTSVRRVGIGTPAALTAANTGAGTWAATARYYKAAFIANLSGTTLRRSATSATLTFTPSGTGTHTRLTMPALLSEGETHWEIYASTDNSLFYLIATTAVGATVFDDNLPDAQVPTVTGTAIPTSGLNAVPTSWKYVATNGNKLIGAGAWETGSYNNRVWFTPALGTLNVGDDERVPSTTTLKNWIDLEENDGGYITGLVGQFQGITLVFKYRQFWKLIPTGVDTAPFRPVKISNIVGAISHKSIVEGEDENGQPAIYFLSHRGPYRYGANGLEYLGHDVEDKWALALENGAYFNAGDTCHGLYYAKRRQVWWVYRNAANIQGVSSDGMLILNVSKIARAETGTRGGWVVYGPPSQYYTASVSYANLYGTTNSNQLVPFIYMFTSAQVDKLLRFDVSGKYQDDTTSYDSNVVTKMYAPNGLAQNFNVDNGQVVGHDTSTNATITVSSTGSTGDTNTATVAFNASTTTIKKLEAGAFTQTAWLQMTVGEATAQNATWQIDAIVIPHSGQEPR